MANIMSQKDVKNHVHRNGFDLSFRNAFTAKVGQILPVMCKEVLPGDKWTIDIDSFTRLQPVQTAAFTRIQEYFDFYFVPNDLLWDKFPNYIVQTNNYAHSPGFGQVPYNLTHHPYTRIAAIYRYVRHMKEYADAGNTDLGFDMFGMSRYENAVRLLQYLGYGDFSQIVKEGDNYQNFAVNIFPLLAYQKICQDYFRYSQWELAKPYLYNLDYIFEEKDMYIDVDLYHDPQYAANPNIFDIQYCNYKKDLIMGLLPSAQFGDTALASPLSGRFQRVAVTQINTVSGTTDVSKGFNAYMSSTGVNTIGSGMGPSVFALRFAEAAQKWKEVTQSGNLDYASQIAKHWNVSVSDEASYLCKWLGGTSGNLSINEVVNNNIDSKNSQAFIAGKGISSASKQRVVRFDSHKHGWLIAVYHAAPVLDWKGTGVERYVMKTTASDYAIPEYDNIGMEEVPAILIDSTLNNANGRLSSPAFDTLGFAPRYYDYKTARDVVRGAFLTSLKDWAAPINNSLVTFETNINGSTRAYLDYRSFKVSPTALDSIFLPQAAADSSMDSDPLLVGAFFDVKVVRNLSVSGLPY